MKIGITVDSRQTELNAVLWSNGVGQNICYLAMVLQRLAEVEHLCLVGCPDANFHPIGAWMGLPVVPQTEAIEQLDIIIELGARSISDVEVEKLRRRGGKLVNFLGGNVMALNFEHLASNARHGDMVFLPGYDACWITPQHWHMNASYARLLYTPNTEPAPHIWDSFVLRSMISQVNHNVYFKKPPGPGWRIGIFDPTVHVTRTFHLAFQTAEVACRLRPDLIKAVMLFNAYHFRERQHLLDTFRVSDLGEQQKATVEPRYPLPHLMGAFVDAVVSHQWQNNLSYLYWDVLYLGYPLIHNSEAIREIGYYYPEFDPETGGEVLCQALDGFEERRHLDRPKVLETLWGFSVDNPAVQRRYAELLDSAMSQPSLVASLNGKRAAKGPEKPRKAIQKGNAKAKGKK